MQRNAYIIWAAAVVVWVATILWSQQPWQGLDQLQITLWTLIGITGVLVGGLQQRGKDYYPANLLLGLAAGAPSVMYVAFVQFVFQNDVAEFRAWAASAHLALWAWGSSLLILYWSLFLVIRVNKARSGGSVNLAGTSGPPTEDQVLEAAYVLTRGVNHGLGNLLQQEQFQPLVKYLRAEGETWVNPKYAGRIRRIKTPEDGNATTDG